MNEIVVSVVMITYNQEEYIKEAIEGVLLQEFNGNIELIIADDNSPDCTPENVKQCIEKNTKKNIIIKYTRHSKNKGMMGNFQWALKECEGKYIAMCEGDDYWTDPLKLQKQVDFLEENEDYVLCYHRVGVERDGVSMEDENDVSEIRFGKILNKEDIGIMDLLSLGNFIHTCSVMFRNTIQSFPYEFFKSPVGDYLLYILLTKDGGKVGKINEAMGVYRRGVGVYSSLGAVVMAKHRLNYLICVMGMLDKESHRKIIFDKIIEALDDFWNMHERIIENNKNDNISLRELLKLLVKKFFKKLA